MFFIEIRRDRIRDRERKRGRFISLTIRECSFSKFLGFLFAFARVIRIDNEKLEARAGGYTPQSECVLLGISPHEQF